jgi:hypothetical protein
LDNQRYRCGCSPDEVNSQWQTYYSRRRTHHCCQCRVPQRSEELRLLDQNLVCRAC